MMSVMTALLDELRSRLPDECLQTDPDVVAAYAQDRALFERAGLTDVRTVRDLAGLDRCTEGRLPGGA